MIFGYLPLHENRFIYRYCNPMMKKIFLALSLLVASFGYAQSVGGYWYGPAFAQTNNSASNYLVELILKENNGKLHGALNYYFKNSFRSVTVNGVYNAKTRYLTLKDIPVTYFGSFVDMEVDCTMDLVATFRKSKTESTLVGYFTGKPGYKYTCIDLNFNLVLNNEASNTDSVFQALKNFKETHQVWKPTAADTLTDVTIIQRKVVNYVVNNEFKKRELDIVKEIEVESDSITLDFYDNGEIDGDSISVFVNNELLAYNRIISTRSVHFDIKLDTSKNINEVSMFADNLGSIPPNTALMIVNDGKNRFEIRLSSNFEKNATIRIRRKKP